MNASAFNWHTKIVGTNNAYLEVQAGLANTQMEYLPMPANAVWEWTEAYGMTTVDTEKIFSTDWTVAREEGARAVEGEVNDAQLLKVEEDIKKICEKKGELVHNGSAWSNLESKINYCKWYDMFAKAPLEDEQKPWLELVETGKFVCPEKVRDNPAGYIYDKKLKTLLEKCTDNWYAYYHLGLMYFYENDFAKAREAFEKSVGIKENPWAYYALSQMDMESKEYKSALANIKKVYKFNKKDIRILKELYSCASAAGKSEEYIKVYKKLPDNLQNNSRLKLCIVAAYIDIGDIDTFEKLISEPFRLCDIREQETSARTVWKKYVETKYMTDDMTDAEKATIEEMYTIPHWMDY